MTKTFIQTSYPNRPVEGVEVDLSSDADVAAGIRALAERMGLDEGHSYSDHLVSLTLRHLGYTQAADAFDEIPKLFS